jgi:formate/nitrite transporter FocA (FNT family)
MFYFSQANAWSWNAVVNIIIVVIGNSVGTLPGIALWKIAGDK